MTTENKLHPLQNLNGCINTASGRVFDLLNPMPEMVDINDIASGLAFSSHFNGQSPNFFSIAQHSIMVCNLAIEKRCEIEVAIVALMHDSAEAYLGDIIKPVKVLWPEFKEMEDKVLNAIFSKFRLSIDLMTTIKPLDIEVQEIEYDQFYNGKTHFNYMSPNTARFFFLNTFLRLLKILNKKED